MHYITRFLLISFLLAGGALQAQDLAAAFDAILQKQFKSGEPGCAALVARNGKIVYHKAHGMADLENNVPMRTDHVFRIGSVTKQFTAVAILQLAEAGKLSLQDDLTKYIPDYPTGGKTITIEHLLTHTSGIQSYTDMPEWDAMVRRKDFTLEALIDFFKNKPMLFDPGTKWRYNNSGYILLGYIIEKASGMSYAQYVEEKLFKPAGMRHSYYDDPVRLIPNRARGYQNLQEGSFGNTEYLSMTQPHAAGSLASTVEDLYNWNQALFAGKLVSKEWLKKAHTPYRLADGSDTRYGYGWSLGALQGSPTIEHGGSINGFQSILTYLPQEDLCVVVLSNNENNEPMDAASRLAGVAIGKPYDFKPIPITVDEMNAYTGVYENEQGQQRIIFIENGRLTSKRVSGGQYPLVCFAPDRFYFENSLTTAEFVREKPGGKVVQVDVSDRYSAKNVWKRTNKPIPEAPKSVTLTEAQIQHLLGDYELAPGFVLTFSYKNGQMFIQATGQPAFEIFPASETKFFMKVVDAQCEFLPEADGKVNKLVWVQGGARTEAKRVK